MHTILVGKEEVAERTILFRFKKPDGFDFTAGQYVDLTLIKPSETDAEGPKRTFSICVPPQEEYLAVATRMRDTAFKRVLGNLTEGAELMLEGPQGSLFLHENAARPAIFIAGGIGITPFRSIVLDALARKLPHRMTLLYSNRRPEDAPFLKELQALASETFTFVPTMTQVEGSHEPWRGERGYIDPAMLDRHVPRDGEPIYYLAGPQAMVTTMRDILEKVGVSRDDIRFEEFSGY
jgi:ferredoxin-NADP reductase